MSLKADPIIALATPSGVSAIAVVRLSGNGVIDIVNQVFKGKDLMGQPSHTVHFGTIQQGDRILDEVLVTLFIAPHSFTKEDSVEISSHGSPFIVAQLIALFIEVGVRLAEPGEFTKRAFLNGRFDLAQAEAVADLIAADSAWAHQVALTQMRGGFSSQLQELRNELIHIAALLELELDFAEEAVAFADREALEKLITKLLATLDPLIESFRFGNVIKKGISVAIVGRPNVGKSTLLNALLQEERAIVSSIAGTTRDTIEGQLHLGGILFRFIDTAGLRATLSDEIEAMGIERTKQQLHKAFVLLYVADLSEMTLLEAEAEIAAFKLDHTALIKIGNKRDKASPTTLEDFSDNHYLLMAAQSNVGVDQLKNKLLTFLLEAKVDDTGSIVVNARHYERLQESRRALQAVRAGLHLPNELLVVDMHTALYALGEITGAITTEDVLGAIFSKFCIGK